METKKFKSIIKEALADQLNAMEASCGEMQGISVCDMLSKDMAQKLIDAGEVLRVIPDKNFKPQDIEYMTRIIAVAKREFGNDNQEVLDFENAIKQIMNIGGDIAAAEELALESLKEDFKKFKLF